MSTALINAAEQFVAWHKDGIYLENGEVSAGMLYYFADIFAKALAASAKPLTEHDMPRHPWSDAEDPIVWAACEEQAILAWGNALLGIKPAEDAE